MLPMEQLRQANLTPLQTECLSLYCFDGLRHREIANRLGVTRQAVTKHIAAAQAKLAKLGIPARCLEVAERPTITPMDPHAMDGLGPKDIKAKW